MKECISPLRAGVKEEKSVPSSRSEKPSFKKGGGSKH